MRHGLIVGLRVLLKLAIAFGLACVVGILWPKAMGLVVAVLALLWPWLDWRAARFRTRLTSVDVG